MTAAFLAWVPNSILPNHYFIGYSISGSYLLFLPVLIIPMFWQENRKLRFFTFLIITLSILSPILNKNNYEENAWLLTQERTQRNLLISLFQLMDGHHSTNSSDRVLVTGLNFLFNPFIHPMSLHSFSKGLIPKFDVVSYTTGNLKDETLAESVDWVKFIRPKDVDLHNYSKVWKFASDGHLVRVLRIGDPLPASVPSLGIKSQDLIIFPDVAGIINVLKDPRRDRKNLADGYLMFRCGLSFIDYQQPSLALGCFEASVHKVPKSPYPYYFTALTLEQLNRFKEAKPLIEMAIAHDDSIHPNPEFKQELQWLKENS